MAKTFNHDKIGTGVSASVHDTGAALFHSATGRVFALNMSATHIWKAIEGRVAWADLATTLSREYGIPFETAVEDVMTFLTELEAEHLIEESPER
jgi:PqqD family protein of HPr-rel-A system